MLKELLEPRSIDALDQMLFKDNYWIAILRDNFFIKKHMESMKSIRNPHSNNKCM